MPARTKYPVVRSSPRRWRTRAKVFTHSLRCALAPGERFGPKVRRPTLPQQSVRRTSTISARCYDSRMPDPNHAPSTRGAVLHWARRYDLMVWLLTLGREPVFRDRVIGLARLRAGEAVLDVGCGTGTLAIAAKRLVGPTGTVRGIDASPEVIARARKKAKKASVEIEFTHAVAEALPFPEAQLDVVLTSMVIHHLPRDMREQCFREMR